MTTYYSLASCRIDAGITSGPSVDDTVAAIYHAAFIGNTERSEPVEFVSGPRIVRFFRETADTRPYVVRN